MLLIGLVIGRKWAIPVGALGWAALVAASVPISPSDIPLAVALGAANVAVGVFARWFVAWAIRRPEAITRRFGAA
jgi:hypothetical protein